MRRIVLLVGAVIITGTLWWILAGCGEGDKTPPAISEVSVSSIGATSAVIGWTTNEPATSQVEYGCSTSYGSTSSMGSNLMTSCNVTLSGLEPNTTYHCRVRSRDASGNENVSADYTFTTAIPTPDTFSTAAAPDWFQVGEQILVTIVAHIYPDEDLIASEVKLLRLNERQEVTDTLGYLSDDGRNGDAQAGDNIYTIEKIFTEIDAGQITLQVSGAYHTDNSTKEDVYIGSPIILSKLPSYPESEPPSQEGSLRLMTFNTKFLTESILSELGLTPDVEAEFFMPVVERAQAIASQILALQPRPDIIALLEVFDEDARAVLHQLLVGDYSYFVYKLDADSIDPPDPFQLKPEDSGLMLFSRFPFAELPLKQYSYWGHNKIAYIDFDEISSPDSFANKGVGFVRIEVAAGRYINVAFAHPEASYGSDDGAQHYQRAMDRRAQLDDVRKIIEGSLRPANLANELVFVMGDLNINGNPKSMWPYLGNDPVPPDISNDEFCEFYEWDYHFNRHLGNSYFSTYFSDSGRYDSVSCATSSVVDDPVDCDPFQTTSGDFPLYVDDDPTRGERLDYILHNNNEIMSSAADISAGEDPKRYLIQHIRRVWEPAKLCEPALGDKLLSDHLAVMADINAYAPYCNPVLARDVALDQDNTDAQIAGKITHKESMQWYCVTGQGGSYSIKTSPNVKADVYEAKDLSRPMRITGEWTRYGMQYSIPNAPFYIRVSAVDPSWTGDYTIWIHLHTGRSMDDAILLNPMEYYNENGYGYGYVYKMPTAGKINDENIVWFKIMPEIGDTGALSSMKAMVDSFFPPWDPGDGIPYSAFWLKLMTKDDVVIAESGWVDYPYDEHPWSPVNNFDMWRHELGYEVEDEVYYLQVHSDYPGTQGREFIIHWETNVTYYIPGALYCYEATDWEGISLDDIYVWVDVDDVSVQSELYLGEFDDGEEDCDESGTKLFLGFLRYKFVDSIRIELREYDELEAAPWDLLGWQYILTLPMNQMMQAEVPASWSNPIPAGCDPDYDYRLLTGKLYHILPAQLG